MLNNKVKIIIAILLILIIGIVAFLCYTYAYNPDNKKDEIQNTTVIDNVVENNTQENIVENIEETDEVDEIESEVVDSIEQEESNQPVNEKSEIQEDNDDEKAIAIAKKDWGDTTGVAFKIEHINNDGTYDIVVRNEDGVALEWYTVNPKTGTFTK